MKAFASLTMRLEDAASDAQRIEALCAHWSSVPAVDAGWALRLLAGRGIGRRLDRRALRDATCRAADIEPWLFDACLEASGDWAETVAHALPPGARGTEQGLSHWMEGELSLSRVTTTIDAVQVLRWCAGMDPPERELLLRLLLGRWRRLASDALLQESLARHAGVDPRLLTLRWPAWTDVRVQPDAARWTALLRREPMSDAECVLPHTFATISVIDPAADAAPDHLGDAAAWAALELWGGPRAQLVCRAAGCASWCANGRDAVDAPTMTVAQAAARLPPDTVVEGEWVGVDRTGGTATAAAPRWRFRVTDVLEMAGRDLRAEPAQVRLAAARDIAPDPILMVCDWHAVDDWASLAAHWAGARSRGVDALRLMRRNAGHGDPLAQLDWRTPPWRATVLLQSAEHTVDEAGRACIELGVALWNRRPVDAATIGRAVVAAQQGQRLPAAVVQLVPVAKLRVAMPTDSRDAAPLGDDWSDWLHDATVQRFGPVRWLRLQRACDIAFDAAVLARRRRSGLELRGARWLGWRDELDAAAVDDLAALRERLAVHRA